MFCAPPEVIDADTGANDASWGGAASVMLLPNMPGIALVARLFLTAVFGVAGVAKAADLPGTRRALAEFGIPEGATAPVAPLLPVAELATAIALLWQPSARWGAVAAVGLLVLFIGAIAGAMARGTTPSCQCFGKLASGPADRRALIRNLALIVPAGFVVVYGPGEGVGQWVSGHSTAELIAIVIGVCAAVLAVLVARLWPQNRHLRREVALRRHVDGLFPPGLPVGARAPNFSLPAADGATVSLAELLDRGRSVALVFIGGASASRSDLLADLARWQATLSERLTIALVSGGSVRENRAMAERHGLQNVLVPDGREMVRLYRAKAVPSVVIVGPDGRIASQTYHTPMMVEAVVRNALPSDPAPVLRVVTADGDAGRRPLSTAPTSFAFESFGVRFRVTADAPEVIERIPSVLPPDARPCSSAEDEFAVLAEEDGRYRVIRPDSPVSTGFERETVGLSLESALLVLEPQIRMYVGLRAPNRIFVHAGVVAHEGKAIVIPGMSYTGKSTLVLALMRAGAVYYSDEFAVIDERGLVHPWGAPLNLRDTTPDVLQDLERFERRQDRDPLRIGAIVLTTYQAGSDWRPAQVSSGQGVLGMLSNTLTALTRPREAVTFITRAVDGAVVLQGDRGEADDVARGLLAAVFADAETPQALTPR